MEYTKDLILNVKMKEVKHKIGSKTTWTSSVWNSVKKHKGGVVTIVGLSIFIIIDIILLTSFVNLLTKI